MFTTNSDSLCLKEINTWEQIFRNVFLKSNFAAVFVLIFSQPKAAGESHKTTHRRSFRAEAWLSKAQQAVPVMITNLRHANPIKTSCCSA